MSKSPTAHPLPTSAWANAIPDAAQEFPLTPLPLLSGAIPSSLRGTLYRNGPARLERGSRRMGHWFDGDGAILAVQFADAGATGVYRFVQTEGYQQEADAGKLLYGNYGMTAPGAVWNQWLRPVKNVANTSVLALRDRLLALWEGGHPYALDLQTLETLAEADLGALDSNQPYSAHPRIDPQTLEIFNHGITPGKDAKLNIYRSKPTGEIIRQAAIDLDGVSLVHGSVMAGPYLVFLIPPLRLNFLPVLLGLDSYGNSLQWRPEVGTEIIVVDRDRLEVVSRGTTDPFFQWHFGNGCLNADGTIRFDFVRYADFDQTNEFLREVATRQTQTRANGTLWQMQLNPQTGQVISLEEVMNRDCEFPNVRPQETGQPWRYTYLAIHRPDTDIRYHLFDAIACFDDKTGNVIEADLGHNRYPMEPLYAPNPDQPDQGWVLTVVYDSHTDSSEVWVFDGDRLNEEPICRLGLPEVIPLGFHGTWKPGRC